MAEWFYFVGPTTMDRQRQTLTLRSQGAGWSFDLNTNSFKKPINPSWTMTRTIMHYYIWILLLRKNYVHSDSASLEKYLFIIPGFALHDQLTFSFQAALLYSILRWTWWFFTILCVHHSLPCRTLQNHLLSKSMKCIQINKKLIFRWSSIDGRTGEDRESGNADEGLMDGLIHWKKFACINVLQPLISSVFIALHWTDYQEDVKLRRREGAAVGPKSPQHLISLKQVNCSGRCPLMPN